MLGINTNGANWKTAVANFLVILGSQVVFQLVQTVPQNQLPTPVQVFWAVVNAAAATFAFYGINKLTTKEEQ